MPNWWDEDAPDNQGGEGNWWKEDATPKKNAFSALRGAKIEAQPSLLSRIGSQIKGFGQELPLIGARGFNLLEDIASGNSAMNAAGNQTPEEQSKQILASEKRYKERQRLNDLLGGAKPGEDEGRWGRIGARMVPGVAAAVATGGGSIPAQGLIQGGVQGAQSLSEGASPANAATSAAMAGFAPGAGQVFNNAGSAIKAPFAKKVDQGVIQALGRLNAGAATPLELPASAVTNSSVARGLEQMASRMVGGGPIEQRGLTALDDLTAKVGQQGAAANPMLAGQMSAADYGTELASLRGIKNARYGEVGNVTAIPASGEETLAQIDGWLSQGTLAPDVQAKLRALRTEVAAKVSESSPVAAGSIPGFSAPPKAYMDAMDAWKAGGYKGPAPDAAQFAAETATASTPRSVADLMSQKAGIRYGGPNASGEAAIDSRLRKVLSNDIDTALEPVGKTEQLAAAKAANTNYEGLKESTLGKTVGAFEPQKQFDSITNALLQPNTSTTDIRRMLQVVKPETRDQLREVLLRKIVGNTESVTPKQIGRGLYTYGKVAKELLTTEQIQRLRDLSTIEKAMGKTAIGSPTTPLLQARKYIATPARALTAGTLGGAAGVAGELATEALIARLLGSKGGQKWLTTGFGRATLPGKITTGVGLGGSRYLAETEREKRRAELDALLGR